MGVMVLIFILSLYVMPALLSFWIYYAHWCKNTDEGTSVEDMNKWLEKNTSGTLWACFVPSFNWGALIFAIYDVYGDTFKNLKIRRK